MLFILSMAIEKENSEFKSVKLLLKIDLVSHHARAEGYIYIYINKTKKATGGRERFLSR